MADVYALVAVHLQGELDGAVLGVAYASVSKFANQLRLGTQSGLAYKVEGAVAEHLCHAHTPEGADGSLYGVIGGEKKLVGVIVMCRSALRDYNCGKGS